MFPGLGWFPDEELSEIEDALLLADSLFSATPPEAQPEGAQERHDAMMSALDRVRKLRESHERERNR